MEIQEEKSFRKKELSRWAKANKMGVGIGITNEMNFGRRKEVWSFNDFT